MLKSKDFMSIWTHAFAIQKSFLQSDTPHSELIRILYNSGIEMFGSCLIVVRQSILRV